MPKIIIADDHPLFRSALINALQRDFFASAQNDAQPPHTQPPHTQPPHTQPPHTQPPDAPPPIESNDFESTIEALSKNPDTDLLLLDLHMPGSSGFLGLIQLRKKFPSVPIVVISASDDREVVRRVISFGASAFIPKSSSSSEISEALHAVFSGDLWVPRAMYNYIFDSDEGCADDALASKVAGLTTQQYKVLHYLTEGRLNKQIAHDMNITEATVKAHITAIFRKLDCKSRTQVVILAQRLGLDPPADLQESS